MDPRCSNSDDELSRSPCGGVSVVMVFLTIHLLLVTIPAWSYFQYNVVASKLHLEDPREWADEAVVQANRAIGLTNLVWVIPINVCALAGLGWVCCCGETGCVCWRGGGRRRERQQRRRLHSKTPPMWPFATTYMLLGVAIYWPIQFWSSRLTYSSADIGHVPLQAADAATLLFVLAFASWSAWYLSSYHHSLMVAAIPENNHRSDEEGYGSPLNPNEHRVAGTETLDERTPLQQMNPR